jgi:hypothetical protein
MGIDLNSRLFEPELKVALFAVTENQLPEQTGETWFLGCI